MKPSKLKTKKLGFYLRSGMQPSFAYFTGKADHKNLIHEKSFESYGFLESRNLLLCFIVKLDLLR